MEHSSTSNKIYTIILGLIATVFFVYAVATLSIPTENIAIFIFLIITALIIEVIGSVEVPYYSYASVAFPLYLFTAMYPYCGRWRGAAIMAVIALFVRTIAINRQPLWFKLGDFVSSVITVISSVFTFCVVFDKFSGASDSIKSSVMLLSITPDNALLIKALLLAILASMIVYFISDMIIMTITAGFLPESYQAIFNDVRKKIRFTSLVFFPIGVISFIGYSINPFIAVLFLPVLIIIYNYLKSIIQEVVLVEQESLSLSLNTARSEVMDLRAENKQITEDLQKKVDELSIVFEMSKSLGASINLEETYNIILSMVRKLIIYQSCVIFLLEKGSLTPVKYSTPYKETLALSPLLQLEETIVNLVVQSRRPLLIPDMQTINEQRIFKDEKCVMCVPLIIKEKIIGVLYVGNTKPGTYNDEQLNILSILANSAAIAIESAQLYEDKEHSLVITKSINNKLEKTVSQLSALNEFGRSLVSSLNMEETLDFIANKMKNIVDYQSFIIFTIKRDMQDPKAEPEIIPKRCVGPYADLFKDVVYKMSDGVLGWVISQKKPLLLEDTRNSRLPNVVSHERSSIIVPMVVENYAIGAFYVGASVANYYDEEALNLVSTVTYQTAMAVKNAELYEKMVSLAITDGLTGLYTHRYFQERLGEACVEYERRRKSFSLVMVDVDNFKTYNDTLGHPEGDKLLQEIAALIKSYTRDSDLVCRIGGDEFTVIFKDSDKENSIRSAERIREAFHYRFGSYKVKITASIGVANFPTDAENKKDLLAAADAALYKSKKGGRNQVNYARALAETGGVFVQPEIQTPLPRTAEEAKKSKQGETQALQPRNIPLSPHTAQRPMQQNLTHRPGTIDPTGLPQAQPALRPVAQQQQNIQAQQQSLQAQRQHIQPHPQNIPAHQHIQAQQQQQQQQQQQNIQTQHRQMSAQQIQMLMAQQQQQRNNPAPQNINPNQQGKTPGQPPGTQAPVQPDLSATRLLNIKPGNWPYNKKNNPK